MYTSATNSEIPRMLMLCTGYGVWRLWGDASPVTWVCTHIHHLIITRSDPPPHSQPNTGAGHGSGCGCNPLLMIYEVLQRSPGSNLTAGHCALKLHTPAHQTHVCNTYTRFCRRPKGDFSINIFKLTEKYSRRSKVQLRFLHFSVMITGLKVG